MHQTIRASAMGWHIHRDAYAAVVLAGSYEEAGDNGRFKVQAGDVVFHDHFDGHLNRFPRSGAVVLNLSLNASDSFVSGVAQTADIDSVVRTARRSKQDATALLIEISQQKGCAALDWPDLLAADLKRTPSLRLGDWADRNGLAPRSVSRGFFQVFGISPEAFRLRCRTRKACNAIARQRQSLSDIAAACGFADQSHMTRSIRSMTGLRPEQWKDAANGFKTNERSHR